MDIEVPGSLAIARTWGKALEKAHTASHARSGIRLVILSRAGLPGFPVTYVVVDKGEVRRLRLLGWKPIANVQSLLPQYPARPGEEAD